MTMHSMDNDFSKPVKVVLINPYELGRQPFALAEPVAWLRQMGYEVTCVELSQQRLTGDALAGAGLVALFLGMHTATRIAIEALPRIRALAPTAHLCAYGLYAPVNAAYLHAQGIDTILDGEPEAELLALARDLQISMKEQTSPAFCENSVLSAALRTSFQHTGGAGPATANCDLQFSPVFAERVAPSHEMDRARPAAFHQRIRFIKPDRSLLPPLGNYAHLSMPNGAKITVGFAESTRGCKHLCRHCPVVPVYEGRFRAVPLDIVMEDVRQQVNQGAQHISFGDPDFLNGPTHALRIARALHAEFPAVTFDATIKVQHLLQHEDKLPELKRAGMLFVTSAVETVDDQVLKYLDKNHTRADFVRAVALLNDQGIALSPTFIPFTPWTTLDGYIKLLATLIDLRLAESVAPIQLAIRLLVPRGSYLLKLKDFSERLDQFDPSILGYRWRHSDPLIDRLQRDVMTIVETANASPMTRRAVFEAIWQLAHDALGRAAPSLDTANLGAPIPALSENWYCCAEPTEQQLQQF
jgi:radical SAM superfamily enzyme YgiQ (UPF0313 family)